jgi:uncharacterized membrane protein YfcA
VVSVWAYRHTWDRRNVVILLLGAISGIATGYLLAAQVSDAAVKLAVGVISVAFAVRRIMVERQATTPKPTPADVPRGIFWGWVTGFTSMVSHAGGPPFQIYVMPQRLPRDIFVGTGAVLFALINWIKVPPYLALGQFTAENMATAGALFPVAIASTWAGVLLVRRVSGQSFYTAVYVLLILVGAKLIYDGVTALV